MEGLSPTDEQLARAVSRRELFPCFFGAALRLEGVDALLEALERYTLPLPERADFGARIFKITKSEDGQRLTWLKVTGGELRKGEDGWEIALETVSTAAGSLKPSLWLDSLRAFTDAGEFPHIIYRTAILARTPEGTLVPMEEV